MSVFEETYRRYSGEIHRFARYLSGDPALAEDIVSETFVRAWTSPSPIRTATVKAYLLAIARNVYLEELRKRRRREPLTEQLADCHAGPEHNAEQRLRLQATLEALQQMPEPDRSALLMRALDEAPYEEIGAALGISTAAAKVKVHRARLKLAYAIGS